MSKSKYSTTSAKSFREREHRYSGFTVAELLTVRMEELSLKNVDLQKTLGFPQPNVISMMRRGSMRVPESRAIAMADALQLDRTFVLGKVMSENNPDVWDAVTTVLGDWLASANDRALLDWIHTELDGHDLNLAESPEFTKAAQRVIHKLVVAQKAKVNAALDRGQE